MPLAKSAATWSHVAGKRQAPLRPSGNHSRVAPLFSHGVSHRQSQDSHVPAKPWLRIPLGEESATVQSAVRQQWRRRHSSTEQIAEAVRPTS